MNLEYGKTMFSFELISHDLQYIDLFCTLSWFFFCTENPAPKFDSEENNSPLWKSICNTSHSLMAPNPGIWQKDGSETKEWCRVVYVFKAPCIFRRFVCFSSFFRLACVLLIALVLLANEMRWRRITTASLCRVLQKLKSQCGIVWISSLGTDWRERALTGELVLMED